MDRNHTIDGECSGCGQCCTSILPLSQTEITRIKAYMAKHHIKANNLNAKRPIFDTKYIDICPFLDDNKKCMIYDVRPEICRYFICSSDGKQYFNHADKHIVNLLTTFFPRERCENLPDITVLQNLYEKKKKDAGIK